MSITYFKPQIKKNGKWETVTDILPIDHHPVTTLDDTQALQCQEDAKAMLDKIPSFYEKRIIRRSVVDTVIEYVV